MSDVEHLFPFQHGKNFNNDAFAFTTGVAVCECIFFIL